MDIPPGAGRFRPGADATHLQVGDWWSVTGICLTESQAAGDLSALSDLSLATVPEHLKVLRKTGLLQLDRQGMFWMYRTDAALLDAVAAAVRELGDA